MAKKSDWLTKDLKYNWHPYTQMQIHEKYPPLLIERARGIKLFDANGNYYYDTISSWWCTVHGHNHPKINAAIKKQLSKLDHCMFAGLTHKTAIELSEKLLELAPQNLARVFYSDDGSTAVETALKMSFQYWQNIGQKTKTRFVALADAYHGDTVGTMGVSGVDLFNQVFSPLLNKSYKVPSPNCYRCPVRYHNKGGDKNGAVRSGKQDTFSSTPLNRSLASPACKLKCLAPLEKLLAQNNQKIAALILEPLVMAAGGMIVYPKEYLVGAAALAKKYQVHLIVDEVATGFGRTGKMFAIEHCATKVQPDFMCLSKGLTAGYLPMGATLTTEKIYRAFYGPVSRHKTFYHGHTYTANPIACAIALSSLKVFEKEKTLIHSQRTIARFHQRLEKIRALPYVGDVRALGFVGVIELVKDKSTKQLFAPQQQRNLARKIYQSGLKEHLLLRPLGNLVYLWLPLSITPTELEKVLDNTEKVLINNLS